MLLSVFLYTFATAITSILMTTREFISKFCSTYVWGNIWAMVLVVFLLGLGVKYGIIFYTHHGEAIAVPDLTHKIYSDADDEMEKLGLKIAVGDTGYVRSLPPDCILEQSIPPGQRVKSNHIIYVTINASSSPTIAIPDIIDNSSLREAEARLTAIGFKLTAPDYVSGEKDWVYGIKADGHNVVAGQRVAVDKQLTIVVGDGKLSRDAQIEYVDPDVPTEDITIDDGEEDNFEEVTSPEETESSTSAEPTKPQQQEKKAQHGAE